jgi:hypothetical protein
MVCITVFMQHVANNPDKVNGTAVIQDRKTCGRKMTRACPAQGEAVFPCAEKLILADLGPALN